MLSYPYIEALFRAVLAHSAGIQGRFHICPYWLNEINSESLERLISETLIDDSRKTYPAAFMMPPKRFGEYYEDRVQEQYRFGIFFLKQTGVTSTGAIQQADWNTNTTTHRILEDWHDMGRCAADMLRVLRTLILDRDLGAAFAVSKKVLPAMDAVSTVGDDKVSGVLLQFAATVASGCIPISDYPAGFVDLIRLPAGDPHPIHPL